MTQLSLIAQVVLDAYHDAPIVGVYPRNADALGVAAAIRALVEQTLPEEIPWDIDHLCAEDLWDQRQRIRAAMLAVADELEASQ